MPPQARVGDASMVPADVHGCPACPHPAVGPAISGSADVLTNGLPSVRVGDTGVHSACCGPNKWNAKTGSGSVLINGRKAHRINDLVKHCGGIGRSISGSPNVIIDDNLNHDTRNDQVTIMRKKKKFSGKFIFIDERSGEPIAGLRYAMTLGSGILIHGTTDNHGSTEKVFSDEQELVNLEITGEERSNV